MTDKPTIFSAPMVRALLDGRKTQTRRVTVQPCFDAQGCHLAGVGPVWWDYWSSDRAEVHRFKVPYATGDRLYVREAMHWTDNLRFVADDTVVDFDRMPEGFTAGRAHVSGMFMPRWASRLTLTVTEVRVQRLQEISVKDAIAEGIEHLHSVDPRHSYRHLWNSLHGPDAWDANPWVVALSFTVQRGNIDAVPA